MTRQTRAEIRVMGSVVVEAGREKNDSGNGPRGEGGGASYAGSTPSGSNSVELKLSAGLFTGSRGYVAGAHDESTSDGLTG